MWFEFPDDEMHFANELGFFLGSAMLIFPVVEANARGFKSYQLPGTADDV